ncbi:hypothetical protein HHK36_011445 [Tetracentron sinense]|uniref:Uncharacterized protein n=1 Tax=Tetracentron sinense TaxID=13715 RepID=A0A834ZDM2_TETSI|nr:hypothetical protein HHK36_011445 [Tetracentron sinense]
MSRQYRNMEGLMGGPCKIRKRGCASSSSSSSIVQNYRFKRAILVGKRGGSSTPVPTWMISSRSPSVVGIAESPKYPPSQSGGRGKQAPVSARKLAATLWEMNEIPSPRVGEDMEERRIRTEMRGRERVARSVQSGSFPPHLSDPSHSPVSERMDRSVNGSYRRRTSAISQRIRLSDHNVGVLDSISNASLMEIETRSRGRTPTGSMVGVKTCLKDVSNGLTTSKELLKILNRMWGLEDQHPSSKSVISALRVELERARMQVDQLIQEQRSDRNEINYLMKCVAEEKAAWKSKEQERIRVAIESISEDLVVERKLRRRSESLNKNLGKELAETKASLLKVVKELESEKRARDIMEQVCDKLTTGVGGDKAEVEELKRQSSKVRKEVEKDREKLQVANMLREERVQMKLSEARHEEKNTAVDKLRNDLEASLRTKNAKESRGGSLNHGNNVKVGAYLNKTHLGSYQNEATEDDGEVEDAEEHEEDLAESDLHSIELNMDKNNKNYKWTYANGAAQEDPKRVSVEKEMKGRKSNPEKIPRGSMSLERGISDQIEWDVSSESFQISGDGCNRGKFSELEKQAQRQDYRDKTQRDKLVKGLREHILSGSRIASAQGFASPTRQWSQTSCSRNPVSAAREGPYIAAGKRFEGEVSGSQRGRP